MPPTELHAIGNLSKLMFANWQKISHKDPLSRQIFAKWVVYTYE